MIVRPQGLDLRRSLRVALGNGDPAAVEKAATRQERTIDAILQRLYDDDDERRREIVLLADEVGLGKTFVALGVAWSVLHQRSAAGLPAGPVLVVTPHAHALFRKWRREAEQFLKLVAPSDMRFAVETASTPHDLAHALRKRRPTLVIARMSAFSGQLHRRDIARMAAVHSLLHMDDFELSMNQRLEMLSDWPTHATRTNLDLRRSSVAWEGARSSYEVGFDDRHVRAAWRRLERTDSKLCKRMTVSWNRARSGRSKRSSFWEDLREICRAALGQTVPHRLPLVIVDEIHNWKNHPASWWRFLHTLGLRMDRLLGLSATPFQLGPHELIRVLELRRCIDLSMERARFLEGSAENLKADLRAAEAAGESLRRIWAEVDERDLNDLERAWPTNDNGAPPDGLPPRLTLAFAALMKVRKAHVRLGSSLRPFLLRHRRDVSHRAWWVGREADPWSCGPREDRSVLRWRSGLDVTGDAELVHYLMMRAVQEQKDGRGSTSLGADLGGSYDFFREKKLARMLLRRNEEAKRYLGLVQRAVSGDSHEHPKVAVTADRAFRAWREGDKTLVFCFNIATVDAVRDAVKRRIDTYITEALTAAFKCKKHEVKRRFKNFRKRLYNNRQSVFLSSRTILSQGRKGVSSAASPFASETSGRSPHSSHSVVRPGTAVASIADVCSPPLNRFWWHGGESPIRGGHGSRRWLNLRCRTVPQPPIGILGVARLSRGGLRGVEVEALPHVMKTSSAPDITLGVKTSPRGRACSKAGRVKRRSPPTWPTTASSCRASSRAGTRMRWRGCREDSAG